MSEILRSRHECAYCGWTGSVRDHVPALSSYWLGHRKQGSQTGIPWDRNKVVPACKECNHILHNLAIDSIRERAEFLSDELPRRHRKVLDQPVWAEEEISALGPGMRRFVRAKATQRQILIDRLAHLGVIARFGSETPKEYWSRVEGE